ncbi:MAG: FAD-binding oxidoreductase [Candidatus Omnitrophica bacterium]|nr:FAD-binding oxidoreductase [Candidatus Omnitrophota bacterium]
MITTELELKVKEIIPRTENVKSFRLDIDRNIDYKAGQFLCVSLKTEKECKRYLSISSSPTEQGYIEFTKKITQSDFSTALNNLKPGDSLIVKYPMGNFTLRDDYKKIAFLSGGIGITPIRSMAKFAADKKLDIDMILVYANRSIRDIVFKEDFDIMQKQHPKLKVAHVLCEPAPGFKCVTGLINAQVIKNEILDYPQRKFYICGPPLMIEAMQKILTEELFLPKEGIITEKFMGY